MASTDRFRQQLQGDLLTPGDSGYDSARAVWNERFDRRPALIARCATAFPHRSAAHGMHIFPGWVAPGQDDEMMAWARRLNDAMAPFGNGGVYVNLLAEDDRERIPAAYGANYSRLVRLKNHRDPENFFRMNHNVEPTG